MVFRGGDGVRHPPHPVGRVEVEQFDVWRRKKNRPPVLRDEQSHSLSIQRKTLQHKIEDSDNLGVKGPCFRTRFRRKVLPLS